MRHKLVRIEIKVAINFLIFYFVIEKKKKNTHTIAKCKLWGQKSLNYKMYIQNCKEIVNKKKSEM